MLIWRKLLVRKIEQIKHRWYCFRKNPVPLIPGLLKNGGDDGFSNGWDGAHAKPGTVLSTSHVLTILMITTVLRVGTVTAPILQMKVRKQGATWGNLPKVTEPISGRAGTRTPAVKPWSPFSEPLGLIPQHKGQTGKSSFLYFLKIS